MRISHLFLAAAAIAAASLSAGSPGYAQNSGASYVVSYIEVAPSDRGKASRILRGLRDAGRKEAGNTSFIVLERVDRPQHFALIEGWKDAKAQADHEQAVSTKQARDKLKPLLVAPYDERPLFVFLLGPSKKSGTRAIYAVTHVDFVGAKKDVGLAALKELSGASVNDAGNLRYDVLQQTNRPNHITLIEVWRSRSALEAHEREGHTRKFRDELLPIGGALYDQRLYRVVD